MMRRSLILCILVGLGLASCGTFEVDIERNPAGTATTAATLPFSASASPLPSLAATLPPAPSALPYPSATPTPAAPPQRIVFANGATQSIVRGTLQPGQTNMLVLGALKAQVLIVSVDTPNRDAILSVYGADGQVIPHKNPGSATAFIASLPATQDYYLRLRGGNSPEPFTLNVIVAARIQFAAGEKRDVISGRTVNGLPVTYSANAQKGQTMHVSLDVSQGEVALAIWGLDNGEPYLQAQSGSRDFGMILPETQDYVIEVVPQAGSVVDYIITVEIY